MLPPVPPQTAPRAPKPPQKRPAQVSSQDASLHPPKKQRLAATAKSVVKVAGAAAGARANGGKGKRRDAVEKGGKGEGLIPTATTVEGGSNEEMETVPGPRGMEPAIGGAVTAGTATSANGPVKETPSSEKTTAQPPKSDQKSTSGPQPQTRKPTPKTAPKPTASHKIPQQGAQGTQRLQTTRRIQPMKPLTSDGQHVLGRPKAVSGSNPTRAVEGRDVVFVTRKTGLGSYMRRCKALLVEDGLNQITLHALCVAIPHAVMLLYALVDILPFPRQFIHHEIQTSSVECHDELSLVAAEVAPKEKGKSKMLAIFEEDEAGIRSRTKSGIRITIRIGKGARVSAAEHENPTGTTKGANAHKARPNKVQRVARRAGEEPGEGEGGEGGKAVEEEERMNEEMAAAATVDQPKQSGKDTSGRKQQGKTGNPSPRGPKKQKVGGGKGKPRTSTVAMDVD